MRKRLLPYGFLAIMVSVLFACQKEASEDQQSTLAENGTTANSILQASIPCGTPMEKDLMDMGGTIDWGSIIISNDDAHITVKVNSELAGMYLSKITVSYGSEQHVIDQLSANMNWLPCDGPSLFDRQKTYAPVTKTYDTIRIDNSNFQADGCIWMSVQVSLLGDHGTLGCAFAYPYDGSVIGSAQWQTAFKYCQQECPPEDCGQLRTQTPGGWGAPPNGNNSGTYLHANFAAAFPNGLTVGCTPQFNVHLTSAQAITDLLPTGGQAAALMMNYTDPAEIKNVLVGHLVALTLATGFDVYDADFGNAGITLGQMEIGSGAFAGWTVNDFLAEANKALGGCGSYTAKQVLETADKINQNYVDGNIDNGFLVCPGE
ncbi:hypothetical protein [Pseudoflavitalea rhizosphaerae]|uniref:hypothetical protein n=1 Tax=Pseudoflavitalea rhizosphaerae TaxID=1884793 RepID=UPI000F8C404A|nr:hypothetical protein [Pseudoflavitalea rhizosphaerae]